MPDHRGQSRQADRLSAGAHPPVIHQPHGHGLQNVAILPPAGDGHQHENQEDVPLPLDNAAMQGIMQGPHHLPRPYYYNAAAYHQPQPDYPAAPYMYMQQDERVAPQGVPAYPQALAPEAQENPDDIFGYAPADPVVGPPQYFPGPEALPNPAPLPNVPPVDGLSILAGRYINNPGTHVNTLRIEPGPAGRFEVWIVLEMADIL